MSGSRKTPKSAVVRVKPHTVSGCPEDIRAGFREIVAHALAVRRSIDELYLAPYSDPMASYIEGAEQAFWLLEELEAMADYLDVGDLLPEPKKRATAARTRA